MSKVNKKKEKWKGRAVTFLATLKGTPVRLVAGSDGFRILSLDNKVTFLPEDHAAALKNIKFEQVLSSFNGGAEYKTEKKATGQKIITFQGNLSCNYPVRLFCGPEGFKIISLDDRTIYLAEGHASTLTRIKFEEIQD